MYSEYHTQLVRLLAHIDQRMAEVANRPVDFGDSDNLQRIATAYYELERARQNVEDTLEVRHCDNENS